MITIGTPVDNLAQGSSTQVDKITLAQNSGQDGLAKADNSGVDNYGVAPIGYPYVDNYTLAQGSGLDNLFDPITRTNISGMLTGNPPVIGVDVLVGSTSGFPASGMAYMKIGTAFVPFTYASLISGTFQNCHSVDGLSHYYDAYTEISLYAGADNMASSLNGGADNLNNALAGGSDTLTQGASTPVSLTYISQIRHLVNSAGNNIVDHLGNQIIVNNKE